MWYLKEISRNVPMYFLLPQWLLSQVAVFVDPDLVRITPLYDPSAAAEWFQVWIVYFVYIYSIYVTRSIATLLQLVSTY